MPSFVTAICGALYSVARDDAVHTSRRRLDIYSLLADVDRDRDEDGRPDDGEDESSSRGDILRSGGRGCTPRTRCCLWLPGTMR